MSGGTRSYEMARRMVYAGHDVQMITSYRDSDPPVKKGQWFETDENGIHVHWLVNPYTNKMSFSRRIYAFIRYALFAGTRAVKLGGDILFASSTPLTIAIPALYAKNKKQIPMVFEVRDLWPEIPIGMGILKNKFVIFLAKRLEKMAYFGANHVIALSPDMARGVIGTGYPNPRISVIPNSCDTALFNVPPDLGEVFLRKHPELSGGPIVLYAGTLGLVNGVSFLVDIAESMNLINRDIRFVVVGQGSEEPDIRLRAQKKGVLGKNFFMLGQVPKMEMPAILSACSISCSLVIDNPVLWMNSANKAFDSFAANRPLAINHGGWIADLLVETNAGIVIHRNNSEVAATQINDFLNDSSRMGAAREATKMLADERFSRDHLARKLIGVLEDLVTSTGQPDRLHIK